MDLSFVKSPALSEVLAISQKSSIEGLAYEDCVLADCKIHINFSWKNGCGHWDIVPASSSQVHFTPTVVYSDTCHQAGSQPLDVDEAATSQ